MVVWASLVGAAVFLLCGGCDDYGMDDDDDDDGGGRCRDKAQRLTHRLTDRWTVVELNRKRALVDGMMAGACGAREK